MENQTIKINEADNVAVALCNLKKGETHEGVTLADDIPKGHKFALADIAEGENIIKFGTPIARALTEVPAGALVHTHNVATCLSGVFEYSYNPTEYSPKEVQSRTVNVYRRENGEVGIRNELWIVPITGCANGPANLILKTFKNRYGTKGFDGVYALSHGFGASKLKDGNETQILQKLIRHPNAGGVLVVGVGGVDDFRVKLGGVNSHRIKFLDCREVEDEIESGVQILNKIAEAMLTDVREAADISCLKIGLKCGNPDWLSGVTANPLLGKFTDYVISAGGTAAFSEVPEMFGAEQLIMNRADSEETYEKILNLVGGYKESLRENGLSVYEYPTLKLLQDGVTTVEEKSAICMQKAGSSAVCGVIGADERIEKSGLNILFGAGDDLSAVTNLAAAGCQLIMFTTGHGTPVGGVVPTVKISSDSALAKRKSNWIDFNAGEVKDKGYEAVLEKLIDFAASVASGKMTKNEVNDSREITL